MCPPLGAGSKSSVAQADIAIAVWLIMENQRALGINQILDVERIFLHAHPLFAIKIYHRIVTYLGKSYDLMSIDKKAVRRLVQLVE